jgi:hypothetical protein
MQYRSGTNRPKPKRKRVGLKTQCDCTLIRTAAPSGEKLSLDFI